MGVSMPATGSLVIFGAFDLSMERHWVLVSCVNLSTALGNTYQHPQVSVHTADAGLRTMPVPAEHVGVTDEQTRTATTRVVERDSFRTPETRTEDYSYTRLTLPRNRVMITPRETTPEGSPDTEVATIGPAIGLPAGGPSPGRAEHSAIVYRHVMVVFGGYDGRRKVNTIAVVDLHSGRWFCPRPLHETHASGRPGVDYPHRRCKHSAVVHCNKMYVFGGFQYRNKVNYGCSDLFVLDLNTWTWQGPLLMHGDGPQAIQGHAAVACLDSMYVFGGKVRMQRSMVSGHAVPSSPGRAALPAAGTAGISPTPPELRSSGLNGDIWEYRFDVNKWRRIAFHQRTVASTGETSSERMPIEPEPRQLAGLAVIADQNPLRCTVYLFGGVNKTKDHFFGDMYAFYGLGSDNYRALRPCALCADLGKALNDPSLADVIFTVAERVQMPMENMAAVLDSGSSEAARALGAPPRSSMAEAPTHQYDSMDTNTTDSSIDDSDNDRESSAHVDAEHVSSTDPIGTISFPARQPWPMRRFYAHRVILASRSEYFANMFRTGLWESGHGSGPRVIHLPGISAAVFEAVLRYLYTGELHYPSTIVETPATGHVTAAGDPHGIRSDSARNSELRGYFMLELLQAADMLRLDQLRDLCAAQVEQALCPENVAFVLEMAAQSQDGMGGLKAYCVAYIIHHFAQVIQTIAWQNLLRRDPAGLGREVLQAYYESTAGPGSQHSAEGR
ncbi:Leucine-zipper-like transcriptional regulator 1 [Cyanidiococcus yangmingshanensis]|uniref:Leucine-zipper-like transcriptional regulator 1 n=1 Tax=Cyanidiococcus yangmingshanensis TaxID=2690220 RepID=A0A7J7IHZ7_9RHOD|nr:Leucine-zipper-like transcriptional regulator 1 [Cyanidiococcus yangmingshanensis]